MFGKNKVKEFEKGMEAGAKPFGEKLENIGNKIQESSEKLLNNVSGTVDTLIDIGEEHDVRIEDLENARKYQLKTFESIDTLSDNEKKLFSGLIFTFASQLQNKTGSDSSELQKDYINAIYIKLDVSTPQQDIPLESAANIQDSSKQLFLLSLLFEYAFLGNNTFDFYENYGELFDSFRFNKNDISNIQAAIEAEIKIRGVKGLVKKYEKLLKIPELEKKSDEDGSKTEIKDYVDEETKNYFNEKFLTPRLTAGKHLFDLGIKKLQIANNLFKPIVDEKNSWIYKCTEGFEKGDLIAFLGAGVIENKKCPAIFWLLYDDEELKNNQNFISALQENPVMGGAFGAIIGASMINPLGFVVGSITSSIFSSKLEHMKEKQKKEFLRNLDDFCTNISDLCEKETTVLNYIENIIKPFYEKNQKDKY